MKPQYQRIAIVGLTGSGKTTLARKLAAVHDLRHIEIDDLFHGPNWTEPGRDVFRQRIEDATSVERWVSDGNYSIVRDIVWARADTIIWLDYPRPLVFWRLLSRTLRRLIKREALWTSQNTESWRRAFLTRESLFVWALQSYPRHQVRYPPALAEAAASGKTTHRFRSPRALNRWLAGIDAHVG